MVRYLNINLFILILIQLAPLIQSKYKSVARSRQVPPRVTVSYGETSVSPERRLIESSSEQDCETSMAGRPWQPLRIQTHFVRGQSEMRIAAILQQVTRYLSSTLQVRRMSSPLRFARVCLSYDEAGRCLATDETVWPSCGQVKEQQVAIPAAYLRRLEIYDSFTQEVSQIYHEGQGGQNADFLLLVTAEEDANCGDSSGPLTLAFATPCALDQCDRPLLGLVNVCPHLMASEVDDKRIFATLLHEVIHTLGFTAELFSRMRFPDGRPRVARDHAGNPHRVHYSCSEDEDGELQIGNISEFPSVHADSYFEDLTGVVEFFDERGMSSSTTCTCPGVHHHGDGSVSVIEIATEQDLRQCLSSPRGGCVAKMVTEAVTSRSREYFDCPSLQGLELENHTTSNVCSFLDPHWEKRILGNELMTAVQTEDSISISPMTLAFFEDSGWYKPDYSHAAMSAGSFGFGKGCDMAKDSKCISDDTGLAVSSEFCTDSLQMLCSSDHLSQAFCDGFFQSPLTNQSQFNYFGGFRGAVMHSDYCPTMRAFIPGLCTDSHTRKVVPPEFGEWNGLQSRCFVNTLSFNDEEAGPRLGRCYEVQCSPDKMSYAVFLREDDFRQQALELCHTSGQHVSFLWLSGSLECADPALICTEVGFLRIPTDLNKY